MDPGPDTQQETKENKQWSIGKINYINQGVAFSHGFLHIIFVNNTGQPKNDADHQTQKHQYYAGNHQDHSKYSNDC